MLRIFFVIFGLFCEEILSQFVNNSCYCVTSGSCGGSSGSNDGSGLIDIRIVNVSEKNCAKKKNLRQKMGFFFLKNFKIFFH